LGLRPNVELQVTSYKLQVLECQSVRGTSFKLQKDKVTSCRKSKLQVTSYKLQVVECQSVKVTSYKLQVVECQSVEEILKTSTTYWALSWQPPVGVKCPPQVLGDSQVGK
jgi:hypothetical protein